MWIALTVFHAQAWMAATPPMQATSLLSMDGSGAVAGETQATQASALQSTHDAAITAVRADHDAAMLTAKAKHEAAMAASAAELEQLQLKLEGGTKVVVARKEPPLAWSGVGAAATLGMLLGAFAASQLAKRQ